MNTIISFWEEACNRDKKVPGPMLISPGTFLKGRIQYYFYLLRPVYRRYQRRGSNDSSSMPQAEELYTERQKIFVVFREKLLYTINCDSFKKVVLQSGIFRQVRMVLLWHY